MDECDELRAQVLFLQGRIEALELKLEACQRACAEKDRALELAHCEIDRLRRERFGHHAETLTPAQQQQALAQLAVLTQQQTPANDDARAAAPTRPSTPPSKDKTKYRPKGRPKGGRAQPALDERVRVERQTLWPAERTCACCRHDLVVVAEEVSWQLDYQPGSFVRREWARPRLACSHCKQGGVQQAPAPESVVPGTCAGTGLLAHVLVSKFQDHLPLNRLEGLFARQGVELTRSTLGRWTGAAAELLRPIVRAMEQDLVRSSFVVHTDGTHVPVQQPEKTHRGSLWVYLGDQQQCVFRYTHRARGVDACGPLQNYRGVVVCDAAYVFDALFRGEHPATEANCWAHARRYFYEALGSDANRALLALGLIGQLFEAERQTKGSPLLEHTVRRAQRCRPVLASLQAWLAAEEGQTDERSPIGRAVRYCRNHWTGLSQFLTDGRIRLDNNVGELRLRHAAVGRKNWLFVGSDVSGEQAAVLWSLLASCQLCGVEPWAYLVDVLERISTTPAARVLELCPREWKKQREQRQAHARTL